MGAVIGIVSAAIMNGTLRTLAGNHFYQVISQPIKTIATSLIIVGMCIANLFIWYSFIIRCVVAICSVLLCIAIYNRDLSHFWHYILKRNMRAK